MHPSCIEVFRAATKSMHIASNRRTREKGVSAIAGEEVEGVATVTATAWGVQGGALNQLRRGRGK